jgi:hypothetical protein
MILGQSAKVRIPCGRLSPTSNGQMSFSTGRVASLITVSPWFLVALVEIGF